MNILDGSITYLIGGIEYMPDDGITWRQKLIDLCWDMGLRIKFIDPCNKPVKIAGEIGAEKKQLQKLREAGKIDEVKKVIHEIRRFDLRFVDLSDYLIAYIDPSVPTVGTIEEIALAQTEHKPILAVIKGGIRQCPVWLLDILRTDEIFESIEQLVAYLIRLDKGEIKLDDRWVLVRKELDAFYVRQQRDQEERLLKRGAVNQGAKVLSEREINDRRDRTGGQSVFERDLISTVEWLRKNLRSQADKAKPVYSKTCCGKPGDCNC